MGDPVTGKGAQFRRWNAATVAWEEIGQVTNIDWGSGTRDMHDITTLGATGGYRVKLPGFRDGGTISLAMLFTRDGYETMHNDFESDTVQNYELVLPDADNTTLEVEGYVSELALTVPLDPITSNVVITTTGQPSINSGSGPSPG